MINDMKTVFVAAILGFSVFSVGVSAQEIHVADNYNLAKASKAVKTGELKNAAKYLRRAVRDSLSDAQLTTALADLCGIDYTLGNLESAEKACDRAIRVDRKNWQAYFNRGYVQQALGNKGAAEADYLKAARLNPSEVRVQRVLARLSDTKAKRFAENR